MCTAFLLVLLAARVSGDFMNFAYPYLDKECSKFAYLFTYNGLNLTIHGNTTSIRGPVEDYDMQIDLYTYKGKPNFPLLDDLASRWEPKGTCYTAHWDRRFMMAA